MKYCPRCGEKHKNCSCSEDEEDYELDEDIYLSRGNTKPVRKKITELL